MFDVERLYELLPAIYRIRDAEQGEPLKALLAVIADQLAVLEEGLAQLYDDQFIETCAEWVVPYIGDLIGHRALHYGVAPKVLSQRAEVAHTIAYRRRKGTAAILEQLARDVTGWDARVVEFFRLLGWTQHMNHIRPDCWYAPDLRRWEDLERLDTPFDRLAHTVDVRSIAAGRGKYNIPNIGIFLWRVKANSLTRSPAARSEAGADCFLFDPLGRDIQLFTKPEAEEEIPHLAEPINVPGPISRRMLQKDRELYDREGKTLFYGERGSFFIELARVASDGSLSFAPVPYDQIVLCDLSDAKDAAGNLVWASTPADGKVVIDPKLGRIRFNDPAGRRIFVTYHYGFSADMGGGEYERAATFDARLPVAPVTMSKSIPAKLDTEAAVEIQDNGRYDQTFTMEVAANNSLELRAANGCRPTVILNADIEIHLADGAQAAVNGLLIDGTKSQSKLHVINSGGSKTATLRLSHCTLVPSGNVCLQIDQPGLTLEIDHCIVGPLRAVEGSNVQIADSIIDAGDDKNMAFAALDGASAGGTLSVENCTVIGKVHAQELKLASNTIFTGEVKVERRQAGCVRFSYLPLSSRAPRRYRCQPDQEIAQRSERARMQGMPFDRNEVEAFLVPSFRSRKYADPEYGQLHLSCPEQIRSGADDDGEMGAFHQLYQTQRVTNLRVRLDEYLRCGLEAGIFFAT